LGTKRVKPITKAPKKPVLPPDTAFEKVKKWADKNYTLVVGIGAAIIFTAILAWGFGTHEHARQARAQADYGLIEQRLPVEGKGSAADWEKVVPDLEQFILKYKDSAPAQDARTELAKAYFETKRYADAVKIGEEALSLASSGHNLRPLIIYQLGYAYEAEGKAEEAARMWTDLKQFGKAEFEREADWNLAKIFESRKEFDKAAELYQTALQSPGDFPPTALIDQQMARAKSGR
jgi:predicted negative regulator of RcsB-dependent stress response